MEFTLFRNSSNENEIRKYFLRIVFNLVYTNDFNHSLPLYIYIYKPSYLYLSRRINGRKNKM